MLKLHRRLPEAMKGLRGLNRIVNTTNRDPFLYDEGEFEVSLKVLERLSAAWRQLSLIVLRRRSTGKLGQVAIGDYFVLGQESKNFVPEDCLLSIHAECLSTDQESRSIFAFITSEDPPILVSTNYNFLAELMRESSIRQFLASDIEVGQFVHFLDFSDRSRPARRSGVVTMIRETQVVIDSKSESLIVNLQHLYRDPKPRQVLLKNIQGKA